MSIQFYEKHVYVVSKGVLTTGKIMEVPLFKVNEDGDARVIGEIINTWLLKGTYYATSKEAFEEAEKIRLTKIKKLKNQITQLESLKFEIETD